MNHPELNYNSPVGFTPKQRLILSVAAPVLATLLRLLGSTCRSSVRNPEGLQRAMSDHGAVILAVWHESLGIAIYSFRGSDYHTMASQSYDGELAARTARVLGLNAVRGSSSKGGKEGLAELQKALEIGVSAAVTIDGPRGPRRIAKHGVAALAAISGKPVIPVALVAKPGKRLRSWDRTLIPMPFSSITISYGEAMFAPANATDEDIHVFRGEIEARLNTLHRELEQELNIST